MAERFGSDNWLVDVCGGEPSHQELAVLHEVIRAVRRIRHGQVQIIIQDSKVVQIDHTEKVRLEPASRGR
jgi:hypothetical protein